MFVSPGVILVEPAKEVRNIPWQGEDEPRVDLPC